MSGNRDFSVNLLSLFHVHLRGALIETKGLCLTHVLHTAWISDDDRVLYNDTETKILRVNILLSYLLDSYVTHVLLTARISNDESHCMYNDMKTLIKTLLRLLAVLSMLFLQTSSQHQVPNITLLLQLHLIYSNDGIQRAS